MPSEHAENNPHSRNLKIISLFFILYWVLGLTPSNEEIRLASISYKISNPDFLKWISYLLLLYFWWRFHLDCGKIVPVTIKQKASIHIFREKDSSLYKKLCREAEVDYVSNSKEGFEKKRKEASEKTRFENFNNQDYNIVVSELCWEKESIDIHYTVSYSGDRVMNNDFYKGEISYSPVKFPILISKGFLKFLFTTRESPDYLLPRALFIFAVCSGFLIHFGVEFKDIFHI